MGSIAGNTSRRERIRFGHLEIDRQNAHLIDRGRRILLRPKTLAVLAYLAERPGRLVRKEELLDAVWPDTSVSDTVLKVCVREAREALGDNPGSPRFIETAHGLGYRFIAAVGSHQLPATVEPFIGRQMELAELREHLEHTRLLTLSGPGGCGKTALALELARSIVPTDEVYWVELDALAEPAAVARAVASALSVHDQPAANLEDALARYLAARGGVVLLDNCEHWLDAVAGLVTSLLRKCGELKVITTSRESLSSPGERVYPVPPLGEAEAVALFTARAEAASPGFEAGTAIAELCRRLDGMPLAIELAATKVKTLDLEQIVERFGKGSKLLDEGWRRGASRHRTLRTTIDWSHDFLDESERTLFRRLSVFTGSFSLEGVEAVCSTGEAIRQLSRLVETSLVARAGEAGRFRLLETIRHYAREKLEDANEDKAVLDRMLDYFVERSERVATVINGPHRGIWLSELDRDHGNLATVFGYACASGRSELAARLASALVWFWFHRGYWTEGRESLARAAAFERVSNRQRLLFGAGLLAWASGDADEALSLLGRCTELAREIEDTQTLAYALVFFGMTLTSMERLPESWSAVEESVALFRAHGEDAFGKAVAVASLGIVAIAEAKYGRAKALLEESVALCHASGDAWVLALGLRNLGVVAFRAGDTGHAVRLLRESLAVQDAIGERWFLSRSLETLAAALALRGEAEAAAVLFGAGEALRAMIGAAILPMYRDDYEKGLAAVQNLLTAAELEALWAEGRALDWATVWKRAGL